MLYQPVLTPTPGGNLPAAPVMPIAFGPAGEVRHG